MSFSNVDCQSEVQEIIFATESGHPGSSVDCHTWRDSLECFRQADALAQSQKPGRSIGRVAVLAFIWVATLSALSPLAAQDRGEISFWESVRDSSDASQIEAYLTRYPKGQFAALAKLRLSQLGKKTPPPNQPKEAEGNKNSVPSGATTFKDCSLCPEMTVVPEGSFFMGARADEDGAEDYEKPQRLVEIKKKFAVSSTAVTRSQFEAFAAESGADPDECTGHPLKVDDSKTKVIWKTPVVEQTREHPVVCIGWDTAESYVKWLTERTGRTYNIISEAQFEYAYRADIAPGPKPRFYFGEDENPLCSAGNIADKRLSDDKQVVFTNTFADCDDGYPFTSPVKSYPPNKFGLYDLIGNVLTWTADCVLDSNARLTDKPDPYDFAPSDGTPYATAGKCIQKDGVPNSLRVIRGSSWASPPSHARGASRRVEDVPSIEIGLRIVTQDIEPRERAAPDIVLGNASIGAALKAARQASREQGTKAIRENILLVRPDFEPKHLAYLEDERKLMEVYSANLDGKTPSPEICSDFGKDIDKNIIKHYGNAKEWRRVDYTRIGMELAALKWSVFYQGRFISALARTARDYEKEEIELERSTLYELRYKENVALVKKFARDDLERETRTGKSSHVFQKISSSEQETLDRNFPIYACADDAKK